MRPDVDAVAARAWASIDAGDPAEADRVLSHAVHLGAAPSDLFAASLRIERGKPPKGDHLMQMQHPDTGDVIDVPDTAAPVYAKSGWRPVEDATGSQSAGLEPVGETQPVDKPPTRRTRPRTDQPTQED